MKYRFLTGLLFGLALAAPAAQASELPTASNKPVVLEAAHLFDGVSGRLMDHGMVVVQGTRILAVGHDLKVPAGARVVDLGDATLMPGFIDAHVHLSMEMHKDWYKDFYQQSFRFPAEQAMYAEMYARRTLEAGFTTVRNVGAQHYITVGLRNAVNAGVAEGPRILTALHAIGSTGGHADQDPYPPSMVKPAGPIQGICNGPAECRAAVRYQIKYGADVIKFMPSGGVLSASDPVDVPELSQEEMDAIVSEAHAWHRKVAAHCHGDLAARMAIKAGVDSIEHGTFLKPDTLRMMKKKGVYLVPTRMAVEWVNDRADGYPPQIAAKARAAYKAHGEMFREAMKIGVPIAFGTDSGVSTHGMNAQEFVDMHKLGMSASDALMTATHNAADLLGVSDITGSLTAGKSADVVAVKGNVLDNIAATEHPVFVMKEGAIYVDRE
ncbi:MAG: amidohydrolase family protein [Gammaproteobacteria bacterium]